MAASGSESPSTPRFPPDKSGASISNRNRIMTGVKFLLRVTLEPPVDISVRQQRHLAFIHRPKKA
jgi:hypothetical protein